MILNREEVLHEILSVIGEAELQRVRPMIGSRTLRAALHLVVEASLGQARLVVPAYWAWLYHDGRGSVHPVNARKLVFFDNALANDPRLAGRYPVRESELRRLTRSEYQDGLEKNAERKAAGLPPFMFVVDSVGPADPHPFFDQLAVNASARAGPTILRIVDRHLQEMIDFDPDVRSEKRTATFTI